MFYTTHSRSMKTDDTSDTIFNSAHVYGICGSIWHVAGHTEKQKRLRPFAHTVSHNVDNVRDLRSPVALEVLIQIGIDRLSGAVSFGLSLDRAASVPEVVSR